MALYHSVTKPKEANLDYHGNPYPILPVLYGTLLSETLARAGIKHRSEEHLLCLFSLHGKAKEFASVIPK